MKALALLALSFTLEAGFLFSLAASAPTTAAVRSTRVELARQAPSPAPVVAPVRS